MGNPHTVNSGKIALNKQSRDLAGKSVGVSARYVYEAEKIKSTESGTLEGAKNGV